MPEWILKPTRQYKLPVVQRSQTDQHKIGPLSNVARLMWGSAVRASLKMMHRLEIDGREHLPEAPSFVLVANHSSHLDALVLGSVLPLRYRNQLFPVAAGEVFFQSPARAAFSAMVLNALPLNRKQCGAHAIQKLRDRLLDESRIYIIFPEGGRSRDGNMHKFKSGIGMISAGTHVPVVPCRLTGTFEAFPPNRTFPRPGKIRVRIGKPRVFSSLSNCRRGWDEIAETLEQDVRELAE
jgi:1-acyl-sn-glycerol-3-phosphate acyltransferase